MLANARAGERAHDEIGQVVDRVAARSGGELPDDVECRRSVARRGGLLDLRVDVDAGHRLMRPRAAVGERPQCTLQLTRVKPVPAHLR